MFDFFENDKNDDFFESCDIEMKEINELYNKCENLHNENEIIKKKENDIYMVYIMFNVVIYMLIIGSNMKEYLKIYYIEKMFPKQQEIYIDKFYNVNMLD
tara:strand:- start:13 stop:312 length:300 start_codon:yes stop_codon:yes gene_type:complete